MSSEAGNRLRRWTRRYSSQREEFHRVKGKVLRRVWPSTTTLRRTGLHLPWRIGSKSAGSLPPKDIGDFHGPSGESLQESLVPGKLVRGRPPEP